MREILLVGVDLAPCHSQVLLRDVLVGVFEGVVRLKTIFLWQEYLQITRETWISKPTLLALSTSSKMPGSGCRGPRFAPCTTSS